MPNSQPTGDDLSDLNSQAPFYRSRKFWGALISTAIVAASVAGLGPAGATVGLAIATPILSYMGILGYIDAKTK